MTKIYEDGVNRDATADEIAQFAQDFKTETENNKNRAADALSKATAKAALLTRLGITADEAALLLQ